MAERSTTPTRPAPFRDNAEQEERITQLLERLSAAWERGEQLQAEAIVPEGWSTAERRHALLDLLYEEMCLRRQHRAPLNLEAFATRAPDLRKEIAVLYRCALALERPECLPQAGERFADFHLIAELGRGRHGRVFVATQSSLADRPVVLKVSGRGGDEHLALARLQHTHIVPLLSVSEEPHGGLRALCLPYLGGLTLATLLRLLREDATPASGASILRHIEAARQTAPLPAPRLRSPAAAFLQRATFEQALCWIGSCLAEALHYAHERGLVHLDLKPSNILIAADLQPMLLDFHLAREPLREGDAGARFGGTPPYMSPEQKRGMEAVRRGEPIPEAIDGRSDIYSLGLVLFEAFAGRLPDPGKRMLPPCRPTVTLAMTDIIAKCLCENPARRYRDGAALAGDLQRRLLDQPLVEAPNRSWRERWHCWRRRKPSFGSSLALAFIIFALLGAGLNLVPRYLARRAASAQHALLEARAYLEAKRYDAAIAALRRGLADLNGTPGQDGLRAELTTALHRANCAELASRLHESADRLRFLYGTETSTNAGSELERLCHSLWDKRLCLREHLAPAGTADGLVDQDLRDLALLGADFKVRAAGAGDKEPATRAGLKILDEAETLLGGNAALRYQRARYAAALGEPAPTTPIRDLMTAARTAWEKCALGRLLLQDGMVEDAAACFDGALTLDPGGLWTNYYYGVACQRQGRCEEAALAFTVCVTLEPKSAAAFLNRGLAFAALRRAEKARADFDRTLELEEDCAEAAFQRSLLSAAAKDFAAAKRDLQQALAGGGAPTRIHLQWAAVCLADNDPTGACTHLDSVLLVDPENAAAHQMLEQARVLPR
ncbi:MAG: serine/threonine-protein kinase [Gemmataceae bacterium]